MTSPSQFAPSFARGLSGSHEEFDLILQNWAVKMAAIEVRAEKERTKTENADGK
jgi:hypothetical protein